MFPVDNDLGRPDMGPIYEVLDAAAWLEDTDVFQKLLSQLGPILSYNSQMEATLNLAAAQSSPMLHVLQSKTRNVLLHRPPASITRTRVQSWRQGRLPLCEG